MVNVAANATDQATRRSSTRHDTALPFRSVTVVLYIEASWSSPWTCTVFSALREKAIPFTTAIAMLRKGSGVIDGMHERTLTGTAPVLQHGSFWLAESLAIIEYLEEVFPEPHVVPT